MIQSTAWLGTLAEAHQVPDTVPRLLHTCINSFNLRNISQFPFCRSETEALRSFTTFPKSHTSKGSTNIPETCYSNELFWRIPPLSTLCSKQICCYCSGTHVVFFIITLHNTLNICWKTLRLFLIIFLLAYCKLSVKQWNESQDSIFILAAVCFLLSVVVMLSFCLLPQPVCAFRSWESDFSTLFRRIYSLFGKSLSVASNCHWA